jgi:hypothetical protein
MLPEDKTVQKEVWTHLGMTSLYHKWYNNREGITLGLHGGLYLTAPAYSNIGMLYLQN